ncbi:MAG: porin [Hyphomicrobiales bacterium]|nr:porin [Hyphomicrobiales bacterium]
MKVAKSLLLGSAAVLATVAGAQAADLPTRKAAPVQYVKICDAYGAGFFYIPGTDTCLRVGGLVMADWAVSNTPTRYNAAGATSVAVVNGAAAANGFAVVGNGALPSAYIPGTNRDAVASLALGRLELDARTQSPWGTVRAFMRVDSYFGAGQVAATGAIPSSAFGLPAYAPYGSYAEGRETTTLNKAFIQFAGVTMGRIQSMFDFYADAVGYTAMRGSNQTVNAIAYTLTMGGGFSATLSVEDPVSHRTNPASLALYGNPFIAGAPVVIAQGTRMPDVVANLRLDQPWGSAQIMGAVHQTSGALNASALGIFGGTPYSGLATYAPTRAMGFAIGGGLKFNLDMLSPGDVLWLQAIYAKGAIGYASGSNLAYVGGVDTSTSYGVGLARISSGNGYNGAGTADTDCIYDTSGSCGQSKALAITAALRHYWTPTISSTLSGSYYRVTYPGSVLNPALSAAVINTGSVPFVTGYTNFTETRLATGLEWNPIKNFGIGAEVEWEHGVTSRPIGLASDAVLQAVGLPAFKSSADLVRGRVRMYRAF